MAITKDEDFWEKGGHIGAAVSFTEAVSVQCCLGLGLHQDGHDRRCADAVVQNKGRCRKRERGKPQTDGAHLHVLPRRDGDRAHWNGETPRAHSLGRIVARECPMAISFYVTDMHKGETSCMQQWVMAE